MKRFGSRTLTGIIVAMLLAVVSLGASLTWYGVLTYDSVTGVLTISKPTSITGSVTIGNTASATTLAEWQAKDADAAVSHIRLCGVVGTLAAPFTPTKPVFADAGTLITTDGNTLDLSAGFDAGNYQIFVAASGEVVGLAKSTPYWWGGVPDMSGATGTDNGPPMSKAIAASKIIDVRHSGDYAWGLATPIIIPTGNHRFRFVGDSRVGTDIGALAADISTGTYPNALFVNSANLTNAIIEGVRFLGGNGFTGWCIWAEEGVNEGQTLFSTTIQDCWIAPGTAAAGFFRGCVNDCLFTRLQFELCKIQFLLTGAGIGDTIWSEMNLLYTYDEFIQSIANSSYNLTVSNITVNGSRRDWFIEISDTTGLNISNIRYTQHETPTAECGLLNVTDSNDVNISNFSAKPLDVATGNIKGIYIDNSEVNISNGFIEPLGSTKYALHLTGAANNVKVSNLDVQGSTNRQIATTNAGGDLRISNSRFDKSAGEVLIALGTETLNVSISNSDMLNGGYGDVSPANRLIDYATSGRFDLDACTIGIDDVSANPSYAFSLTGTGKSHLFNNRIIGLSAAKLITSGSSQKIILRNNFYLSAADTWVEWKQQASHDYAGASADWTLDGDDMLAEYISVSNANGAVNAILPTVVYGHQYVVFNNSGFELTFKVTGKTGGTIANGKTAIYVVARLDVVEIYEEP